jgi:transcriptional regulator with XRE-family HTH domain
MRIPQNLPITKEQSKAARFQLGLSQSELITQSELPGHKLKNFESGRYVPDMEFLEKLRDFYVAKGVDLSASAPPDTPVVGTSDDAPAPHHACFLVSETVSPQLLDQCLERMHANDKRIASILKKPLSTGFFGDYTEETTKLHQELFGALAEGYLIFRLLQGTPIVAPAEGEAVDPKSHSDLLASFFAHSPVVTGKDASEDDEEDEDTDPTNVQEKEAV